MKNQLDWAYDEGWWAAVHFWVPVGMLVGAGLSFLFWVLLPPRRLEPLQEFVAAVQKLEDLQHGPEPLPPMSGPGERDPYARYKTWALRVKTVKSGETGEPIEVRSCPNCTNFLTIGNYCGECGAKFGDLVVRFD